MRTDNVSLIFALGMVGAVAPEIVRGYNLRFKLSLDGSWLVYVLMSIPFVLLGGVVATILPATTTWGAFYAGLSTPIVISTALRTAAAKNQYGPASRRPQTLTQPAGTTAEVLSAPPPPSRWELFISAL